MSEEKTTYATFHILANEAMTVDADAKAPKIIIDENKNWPADDVEGLKIHVWRRAIMKTYTNKTANLVCKPF